MGWSSRFVGDLSSQVMPLVFRLERQRFWLEAGSDFALYSHGSGAGPQIAAVRVEGHRVDPYSMGTTWGRVVVEIVGTDLGSLDEAITRGTFVVLYAGFAGYTDAEMEPIAMGAVRNVKGAAPRWAVEIVDLATGLRQRPDVNAFDARLFDGIDDATTTVNANYIATDTTVTVTTTVGLTDRETGGSGAILLDDGTYSHYLVWSASTGTSFTVTAADTMGTFRGAKVAGDDCRNVAYLSGHPIDIARKVLCSTGAGGNGTYDTYPEDWGLAVPTGLVDHDDCDDYRDKVVVLSSGSYSWQWPQGESVDDGIEWLQRWLGVAGMFLTQRQGRLTVRAIQQTTAPIARLDVVEITDADIVQIVEHEWWSSSHAPEYSRLRVYSWETTSTGTTLSTTTDVHQAPRDTTRDVDLSDRVFGSGSSVYRDEYLNRMVEVYTRTPERLVIRCPGLRLAVLAPGDLVSLTTSRVHSRVEGRAGFAGRAAHVTQVSIDYTAAIVQVELYVYASIGERWA